MRCTVLHESDHRIRIGFPVSRMTLRQADVAEYFLNSMDCVRNAKVNDRSGNAVILFKCPVSEGKKQLRQALENFKFNDEEIASLVPEETGRELNRKYEDKLVMMVVKRAIRRLILPPPVRAAIAILKGIPFLYKGIRALFKEGLTVSVLDAVAIGASLLRRDFKTADSVSFLLTTGELLEEWTRKKSVNDLALTLSLKIDKVWIRSGDEEVQVDISAVKVGDEMILRSSDVIPLDGSVIEGEMTVNQSSMTGEAESVLKEAGSYVYAGTVVDEGECVVRVTKVSGTGKYDQIVKMIEESEKLKSGTEAKAYSLADKLVPYSFGGSILSYLITRDINKAMSFLMVDYSCAMKLSMPLAVLSAIKEAGMSDISVKGGKFLEAVAEADTIVFDKTGTLTHACPTLEKVVVLGTKEPDEMLRIAACLEEHYPHSVATAIVRAASEKGLEHDEMHSKVQYVVAHGVSSTIGDKRAVIGSYHFVVEDEGFKLTAKAKKILDDIEPEYSRIFLGINGKVEAVLCVADPLREEAAGVIDKLHGLGVTNVCMMTGDNAGTASAIARKLNLDEFHAEVLPEDKANYIKEKRNAGHKVIMIGDGVNDTPALSEADAGIAMSEGAAIAREISDITISSDSLEQVVILRKIATALMKRIKSNYGFILGFNSALIALGVAGILPPAVSALLHNGSTIIAGVKSMTPLLPENK